MNDDKRDILREERTQDYLDPGATFCETVSSIDLKESMG
jgi:ribosomal protein S16